jgi:hypothetical protein
MRIDYIASPTLHRFHLGDKFIRGVMGPVGSGKSTGMCAEIWIRAGQQVPNPSGVRRTRWVVIRNTYRELADTTVRTWEEWFGSAGTLNKAEMIFMARSASQEVEILFRALDRPDDVKKLLSLELTGAWVNEAREVPKSIIDALGDRVGRFPAQRDGGCTWRGIIMDTNAPDDDHWWYKLAEEETPEGWAFFRQPGGLIEREGKFLPNPEAENLSNLEQDYYVTRMSGKSNDHIRVYYCAQYGFTRDGKPVIPEYVDDLHCAKEPLRAVPGIPIRVGIDWGLTPAAIFGQRLPSGRWTFLHEVVTENMGAQRFGQLVAVHISEFFPGHIFEMFHGDPAGVAGAQTDERTVFQVFNEALRVAGSPLRADPAPSNDPVLRHGALGAALSRIIDGKPGVLVSPECRVLRKGLAGGYCYRRVQVAGEERYTDKPDKNKYSHPVEAAEYMLIGAGEGQSLVSAAKPTNPNWRAKIRKGTWRSM